jgi:hypothetical protein
MAHFDPYAALLEHMADPRHHYRAQPSSVQVLKQRDLPGRRLYAVTFTTPDGRAGFGVCELRQRQDGLWSAHGSAWGSRGGGQRDRPFANLGGSPGNESSGCYFGGLLESDLAGNIAHVCLVSADGVTLEDTVEEGVALFQGDGPERPPLSTEFYDHTGKLVLWWPIS